ncbi:ribosomal RNA-processing protein 7 homolog A [Octopus bimaculoides]|uniref:RRM domain-containing protein n=1 Tax=Octopus bimaculoides TaxID=37653 RepID=A0A0L8FG33_OCTBM|nr:ribosomal RNA-processing protein 7 homolog A [Octopus bimaculoides]|eukprot:XP_014790144.1 PREDICTED: ribosomal RNA-processing protein 7 homolog A-like [Octopus bimaculoides]
MSQLHHATVHVHLTACSDTWLSFTLKHSRTPEIQMSISQPTLPLATNMAKHNVLGFNVVRVKITEDTEVIRHLFIKPHSTRDADPQRPKNRTLFVINIPPYVNKKCLENFFLKCGKIENIFLCNKPTTDPVSVEVSKYIPNTEPLMCYKVAYVVFQNENCVTKAMKIFKDNVGILIKEKEYLTQNTGVKKWCKDYAGNSENTDVVKKELNDYFKEYDEKQELEKQKLKRKTEDTDAEGWMKVTKLSKVKANQPKVSRYIKRKQKKKRTEAHLLDFYTFQMKETQQNRIQELRKKFEEDKQKIALMKAARKFKPF